MSVCFGNNRGGGFLCLPEKINQAPRKKGKRGWGLRSDWQTGMFIIHSSCSGDEAEESDGLGGVETDEADFKAQVQPGLIIPPHFMSMNKAFLLVQWPPPQIRL